MVVGVGVEVKMMRLNEGKREGGRGIGKWESGERVSGEQGRGQCRALLWSKGRGDVGHAINKHITFGKFNKQNNHGEERDPKKDTRRDHAISSLSLSRPLACHGCAETTHTHIHTVSAD